MIRLAIAGVVGAVALYNYFTDDETTEVSTEKEEGVWHRTKEELNDMVDRVWGSFKSIVSRAIAKHAYNALLLAFAIAVGDVDFSTKLQTPMLL